MCVLIWDSVSFHRVVQVRNWFDDHPRFTILYLPSYSPFFNPIEELFSARQWKVYDCKPHEYMALLQAIKKACGGILAESCQGCMRHARRYFPHCLAKENIDVDENLWLDQNNRHDILFSQWIIGFSLFLVFLHLHLLSLSLAC